MRRLVRLLCVVTAVAMSSASTGAQIRQMKTVMQEKAQNAQGLLTPLVLGDFAGIERYATRLGRLTDTEVASWQAQPDTDYQKQARAFLAAIEELGRASDTRDLAQASAAYASLISSCVNCHQLVRAGRSVSLTPPPPLLDQNLLRARR